MPKVILTVTNDLSYDQRMQRICHSLAKSGWEVVLVGRLRPNSLVLPTFAFDTHRLRCWFDKGKWFYLEFNIRLLFWLMMQPAEVFCAIDLDTILANRIVARLRGKVCVFDAHEYFTEVPEVVRRPRIQAIWGGIARWAIPGLKYCYTVGPALAKIFEDQHGVPFQVIRNVPFQQQAMTQARRLPGPEEEVIILYQGALNEGRGIEFLLEAVKMLPNRIQLWLAGEGDLSEDLRIRANNLDLGDRVRFLGFVQPKDLKMITLKAHVGINLLENKGLSYYYSFG